jgi:hypothetical protein
MTLFKNKYRVESTRLPNYDYACNGWYFVTICTDERQCFFGDVVNGKMHLSKIGQIAEKFWAEIPQHSKHTYIDAYVIMPNHVHGIVVIDRSDVAETDVGCRDVAETDVGCRDVAETDVGCRDVACNVSTTAHFGFVCANVLCFICQFYLNSQLMLSYSPSKRSHFTKDVTKS